MYSLFHYRKLQTRIIERDFFAEPGQEVKNDLLLWQEAGQLNQ